MIWDPIIARFRINTQNHDGRDCIQMLHQQKAIRAVDFWRGKGEQAGVICKDFCLIDFCFLRGPFWLICHLWFSRRRVIFTFSLLPRGSWLCRMVFSSDNSWLLSVLCRVMKYSTSVFIPEAFWKHLYLASTSDRLDLCVYSLWKENGKEKARGSLCQ